PRDTFARLVNAVGDAKPKAIAIDVLFSAPDSRSPAALARKLEGVAQSSTTYALASGLVDGDQELADAIAATPTALGFTFDTKAGQAGRSVAVLRRGPITLDDVWRAPGSVEPLAPLRDAALGVGTMSLPGDPDGKVRRAPLLVGVGDALRPGFAVEAT